MAHSDPGKDQDILLKGGLIVDGSGGAPFKAHLLIRSGRIQRISSRPARTAGVVIDCEGRIVAPGFIDAHSHLDWHIPLKGHDELKYPFLAQGITTVVAGNCGMSAAGFRENSAWKERLGESPVSSGQLPVQWDSVEEYLSRIASSGASQNIALLAGHGSTRVSIRGLDNSPLHPYEIKELLWLLERAMAQGAHGVSLGLQYAPGSFAQPDELKEIATLVKKKGKVLAIHLRAFPTPLRAHAMAALREILDLARATGVVLQISHLLVASSRTWRSADSALSIIDEAIRDGVNVAFDATPFPVRASAISVLLPSWFLARGAAAYTDSRMLRKLKREIRFLERLFGLGPADIQVTNTLDPELVELNGRFLHEIARIRRMTTAEALIDLSRRSAGRARVLLHRCSTDRVVETLICHPACLYMTDAWVERHGVQNPSAFGAFPRLLQLARERRLMPVEEVVRKMTGAAAERFGLAGRGILKEGAPADITVFDWETVADNTSPENTSAAPSGIDYVFVNGKKIIGSGRKEHPLNAGVPLL